MKTRARLGLAAAGFLGLSWPTIAEARDPLFPPEGCSSTSRFNSCQTWAPGPTGDPTDGPLTDTVRDGPLDPPKDPLGLDPAPQKTRAPLLMPTRNRLGGTKYPLGIGQ